MAMGMYTRERVLAKTFAWRIIATLTGAAVAGLLTGEIETAGWFIVIEFPLKMGFYYCLLYTSPSPRDVEESRMPSSA